MDNLKGFILAGHSYGGYIAGNYALKYPSNIKKILFLSPIGITKRNADKSKWLKEKSGRGPPAFIRPFAEYIFKKKISPFAVGRKLGTSFTKRAIKGYVEKR
jgi:pimeloyl-ACP methyl ester carboxylesterase